MYYVCIYITYSLAIFDFVIPEGEMALLEGSPRNVKWKQTLYIFIIYACI